MDQSFDVYGNRLSQSDPHNPAEGPAKAVQEWVYDAATQTFPITFRRRAPADPNLTLEWSLAYSGSLCNAPPGLGLVCFVNDPNGQVRERRYDDFGRVIFRIGPNGQENFIDYNDGDRGSPNQRTTIKLRWDPDGGAVNSDPNSITMNFFHDGLERVIRETRPGSGGMQAESTRSYNNLGLLATQSRFGDAAPGPDTSFTYDVLGRLLVETRPDGTQFKRTYRPSELLLETQEPGEGLVHLREMEFDGRGRLWRVLALEDPALDGSGNPTGTPFDTRYVYDAFDQLASVHDAVQNNPGLCEAGAACATQNNVSHVLYDELGNRTRLEEPNGAPISWVPDARGLVQQQLDSRGIETEFIYDDLGRLLREHHPGDATAGEILYHYGDVNTSIPGGVGRLTRIDDRMGYEEFAYDPAGNMAFHRRVLDGKRFDFVHFYDPLGRRIRTIDPDGERREFSFDGRLLDRVHTIGGELQEDVVSGLVYDANDQLTQLQLGGSAGSPVVEEAWSYDPVSALLTGIDVSTASGRPLRYGLCIDGAGRRAVYRPMDERTHSDESRHSA